MTLLEIMSKWLILSIRKEFKARAKNVPVYIEEVVKKRPATDQGTYQEGFELRIDGPFLEHIGTAREWEARVEINILITWAFNEIDTTGLIKLIGVCQAALSKDFCIYKLGDTAYDDESYWETLQYLADERTETANFGQIDPTNKIYQASTEAHYKVRFLNATI